MTAPIPINLAFEDQLIEEIITKVLAHVPRKYAPRTIYNRGGNGYLRTNIRGFNNAAKGVPFLVVTDLDTIECPATLIENWLGDKRHPNLLLRVAVREAEAWLLADAEELAKFLRIRAATIPGNPDSLIDPKKQLIALAGGSPSSEIRKDICPRSGSTSRVGPNYNGQLAEFVRHQWRVEVAKTNSESLRRTVQRLKTFTPTWAR